MKIYNSVLLGKVRGFQQNLYMGILLNILELLEVFCSHSVFYEYYDFCLEPWLISNPVVKGLVNPKMKILSLII